MSEFMSNSIEETMQYAQSLGQQLRGGECVALRGDLGAGKTCFVRGLARGLGIDSGVVSSPTFVIMQEYEATGDGRPTLLVHVDAYRLQGGAELESIGWEEVLNRADVVVAIEWPERVADALPPNRIDVTLEHRGDARRMIRLEPVGAETVSVDEESESRSTRSCPICAGAVELGSESFPFCSQRCRLADLHRWLGGAYRLSRPATDPRDWEEQQER